MFGNFFDREGWVDFRVAAFIVMLLIIGTIPCAVLAIIKRIKTKEKFTICWQKYMETFFGFFSKAGL